MVSGVAVRGHTFVSSGGSSLASITLPACEHGDRLVVITGGGSRVTSFPGGAWQQLAYETGQEAQGWVMTKTATVEDSGATIQLGYDGGDRRGILAVASEGPAEISLFTNQRFGTAGQTFTPGDVAASAPAAIDDSVIAFAFARNASALPTSSLGAPTASSLDGGSASSAWIAEAPGYGTISILTAMPQRSGHYLAGISFWSREQLLTEDYVFELAAGFADPAVTGDLSELTWAPGSTFDDYNFTFGDLIAPGGSVYNGPSLPVGVEHMRVEAEVVGTGNLSWNLSFDAPGGGYFASSNEESQGQRIIGQAHLYDPVVHAYFGPGFSVPEVYARALAGDGFGIITLWDRPTPVVVLGFRVVLFSKARMPIAAPVIVGTDDGVRRRFVRARR